MNTSPTRKRIGIGKRSQEDAKTRLTHFEKQHGHETVALITSKQVEDWLHGMPLSATSINNYRTVLRAFFEFAIKRGYAAANPAAKVDKIIVKDKPPGILTPDQLKTLLEAAPVNILPVVAIQAFAGIRSAEIHRLTWEEIDLKANFINISAQKSKTAQRRLVKIEPVLAAWLVSYAGQTGKVWAHTEGYFLHELQPVRESAGIIDWPDNALRHSYASYWLAKNQDAAALALQMGHTSTDMIFRHYRELVRPDEAERYWNLFPAKPDGNIVHFSVRKSASV